MDGFFSKSDIKETSVRKSSLPSCGVCRLNKTCQSPKMKPTGQGERKILIVGKIPSRHDDDKNSNRVGNGTRMLKKNLHEFGIDLERDCWKTNAVTCRPPKGRTPTRSEIDGCRPILYKTMKKLNPHMVILLGSAAVESYFGDRWIHGSISGISRWRGWNIPDREYNCWVCPTYHPSFIDQQRGNDVASIILKNDLERSFQLVDKPVPQFKDEKSLVKVTTNVRKAKKYLQSILKRKPVIAIDYETTGLKPDADGHEIVSVGISEGPEHGVAFPLFDNIKDEVVAILKDPKIKMIAANLKFEQRWSKAFLGVRPRGWIWDVVETSHILDNRQGHINSVKFQTFVHFGLMDWSSHLDRYIKTADKSANKMNKIKEAPLHDLLTYNAIDALVEFRLAQKQKDMII